jgi:hypothetical protein
MAVVGGGDYQGLQLQSTKHVDDPTIQISTSSTNIKYLSVLIQQIVVSLLSFQIKISSTCLDNIILMS